MIIAIIPAKATSSRLPGKNRFLLNGIEVYQHAVRYAIQEGVTPIVSTDSEEIISQCKQLNILYYRETVDDSNLCNCINQVLSKYDCEYFAVLQPTSPIRQEGLLRNFIKCKPKTSIYTANKIKIIGHIGNEFQIAYRDQDNSTKFLYQFDGNIVYVNTDWYKESKSLFCNDSQYCIEKLPYTLQIDEQCDYEVINAFYNYKLVNVDN